MPAAESKIASQTDAPKRFGAWVTFAAEEKCRIEAAGQALIRGEAGATDSLISAAAPLCVVVTGQFVKRHKRQWDWRDTFRKQAEVAVTKAVASLDRRFGDGSLKALKSTFR